MRPSFAALVLLACLGISACAIPRPSSVYGELNAQADLVSIQDSLEQLQQQWAETMPYCPAEKLLTYGVQVDKALSEARRLVGVVEAMTAAYARTWLAPQGFSDAKYEAQKAILHVTTLISRATGVLDE